MSGTRVRSTAALVGALLLGGVGCASKPPAGRQIVHEVEVRGARRVDPDEIRDRLATKATSTLLGFTLQYEIYDRFVLDRDLKRIERLYQARGYYDARVQAGRVITREDGRVEVEITVEEGEPVRMGVVRIDRTTEPGPDAVRALGQVQTLRAGEPFEEDALAEMKRRLLRALTDHGYARARIQGALTDEDLVPEGGRVRVLDPTSQGTDEEVSIRQELRRAPGEAGDGSLAVNTPARRYSVRLDPVSRQADVVLQLEPGPLCVFGDIRIEGLGVLPEDRVRTAIDLRPGETYSTAKLESARHSLQELGVFSSIEYVADPGAGDTTAIPVTFKLTPSPLRTLTFGGGLQADVLQSDVHFLAGYDHQNFLGGLRRLTAQVRPGLVLFPTNLQNLLPPERVLPQLQARAELRQPQFLEAHTRGTLRSEFLVYPFLLPARNSAEVPDVVVGYREIREAVGLDRTFFDGKLSLSAFYNLQLSYPFSYLGPLDAGIRSVLVSYISLVQAVDLRDNPLNPRLGIYLANELQVAGSPTDWAFSSDARDVKVQPEARFYAPVGKRLVVATRGSVGFVFPQSYGSTLSEEAPDPTFDPVASARFEATRNRDLQLLFFRAFFSGGPTSNRGYAQRSVGPRGIAPFRLGGTSALRDCVGRAPGGSGVAGAATQVAKLPAVDAQACSVPLGGLSLWEWSGELRFRVTDLLGVLLFADASDVTRQRLALRLSYPHLSVGTGLRVTSPVGLVRLDVGYAIPGLQHIGGTLSEATEGQPATFLGVPIAINLAVGESF